MNISHPSLGYPPFCTSCETNRKYRSTVGDDDWWYAEHRAQFIATGSESEYRRMLNHVPFTADEAPKLSTST